MNDKNTNNFAELARIFIPAIAAVSLFVFFSFYLFLPKFEQSLFEAKKLMIKELVNSAWHMVNLLNEEVSEGMYSRDEAQKMAIMHLREMRYGADDKEYFWINDFSPTLIMHPYRPDLEGKDLSNFSDPAGTKLFMEFVKTAKAQKEGYVSYMWQWKDDKSLVVPKLSFVKAYKPWGWIIGTGIYLRDVEEEISLMVQKLILSSIGILIIVVFLAGYQVRQALKAVKKRQQAEEELIDYKDKLEIKVRDRTAELLAANTSLIENEQRFRSLSDAAFEGIVIIEEGHIVEINDVISKLFGYTASEILGEAALDFIAPEERESVKNKISSGYEQPYETICLRKDGSKFPIEAHSKHFSYKGRKARVTAIRDITEQKEHEKERIKSKKLEATAILAAGIAHDFNNLLGVIVGYVDLVLGELGKDHKNAKDLEKVIEGARKAEELVDQFITFSTGGDPVKQKTSVQNLIRESVDAVLPENSFKTKISCNKDLWDVEVDVVLMSQVFKSVLQNTKESMATGGEVLISAENIQSPIDEPVLESEADRKFVKIVITDQGVGIPGHLLPNIFDPYFSSKVRGAQKGMGLGLTLALSIIEQHDGYFFIKSDKDIGTSAYIYLPAFQSG